MIYLFFYVTSFFLFCSGTIADNIAYGKFGSASMEEIQAAAEAANAHEFVSVLPGGYQTVVGERGVLLSGEQMKATACKTPLSASRYLQAERPCLQDACPGL